MIYLIYDEQGNKLYSLSKIGLAQSYKVHEYNALTGLYGAWHFMGYYTTEIVRVFGNLFSGDFSGLSGIVGIYDTIDTVATDQTVSFGTTVLRMVYIMGAISFSLGFLASSLCFRSSHNTFFFMFPPKRLLYLLRSRTLPHYPFLR